MISDSKDFKYFRKYISIFLHISNLIFFLLDDDGDDFSDDEGDTGAFWGQDGDGVGDNDFESDLNIPAVFQTEEYSDLPQSHCP